MDNLRAIMLMVISMALFAIEDAFLKYLSAQMSPGQALMVLGLTGSLIFALMAARHGQNVLSRDLWHPAVLARNGSEIIGTASFVTALGLIPLTTATAVFQATPLAMTLGAALFLGETVGWRRWLAIGVGFLGVLMIVRPGAADFEMALLLPVSAVIALSARDLVTRRIPARIGTMQVAASGMAAIGGLGLVQALAGPGLVWPDLRGFGAMAGVSLCGIAGYWAITTAMRIGEVSAVTPFRYARLVFALILGVTLFGERPDSMTLLGSALVVGSGLFSLYRERKRRLEALSMPRRGG